MLKPLEWAFWAALSAVLCWLAVPIAKGRLGSPTLTLLAVAALLLALAALALAFLWFLANLVRFGFRRSRLTGALVLVVIVAGAVLGLAAARGRPTDAGRPLDLAIAAIDVGEWDLALAYLMEAQRREPGSPPTFRLLGLVSANAGGRDLLALTWLRAYLAAAPNAPDAAQVRREIPQLETRAARALEDTIRALTAAVDGAAEPARLEARAAITAARRLTAGPADPPRADRGDYEAADWVAVINRRLLGRLAIEDLTALRRTLDTKDREARVRGLIVAVQDLSAGLRAIRDTEAAWRGARGTAPRASGAP